MSKTIQILSSFPAKQHPYIDALLSLSLVWCQCYFSPSLLWRQCYFSVSLLWCQCYFSQSLTWCLWYFSALCYLHVCFLEHQNLCVMHFTKRLQLLESELSPKGLAWSRNNFRHLGRNKST